MTTKFNDPEIAGTGLEPGDEGLGNIEPGEATGLEPGDEGLGNIEGEELRRRAG